MIAVAGLLGRLADGWPLSLLGRGGAAAERGRLRDRLRAAPDDLATLLRLGALCRAAGELDEAIRLHGRARDLKPDHPEALLQLEQDYEAAGRPQAALEVLDRLRELWPDNLWVLERVRSLCAAAGRWPEAAAAQAALLGDLAEAGRRDPSGLAVWCGLRARAGRAALEAGRIREAAAVARQVLRADARCAAGLLLLGDALVALGRPGRAIRIWHGAYEATGHTALLERLERTYLSVERPHRLMDFYHQALLRAPEDLRLRYRLARLCLRLEMVEEAAAHLEVVARAAPGFAPALRDLGDLAQRRGDIPGALDYARRALEATPETGGIYRCTACGAAAAEWADRCPACGGWNTLADPLALAGTPAGGSPVPAPAEA